MNRNVGSSLNNSMGINTKAGKVTVLPANPQVAAEQKRAEGSYYHEHDHKFGGNPFTTAEKGMTGPDGFIKGAFQGANEQRKDKN